MKSADLSPDEILYIRNGLSLKIDSHLRAVRSSTESELVKFHQRKVDEGNILIAKFNTQLEFHV